MGQTPGTDQKQSALDNSTNQLMKLTAVTKTFGYVRYFHPSDQASLVDWNSMALYVAEQTLDSPEDETVQDLLNRLFDPLVVDLEVYDGEKQPPLQPEDFGDEEVLAWQHFGVGLGGQGQLYSSVRSGRENKIEAPADPFGNILQTIDPAEILEHEIRMRFRARIDEGQCKLQGWMRIDRSNGETGFFDNMGERPVRSEDWEEFEIVGKVDDDAKEIYFGIMFFGSGSALVDDVVLEHKSNEADSDWESIDIGNGGFEKGSSRPVKWGANGKGYSFKTEKNDAVEGEQSMRFARQSVRQRSAIDDLPGMHEVTDSQIADNLRIRLPLALSAETVYTAGDSAATDELIVAVDAIDPSSVEQNVLCSGNVIVLWNVFQHFYPYFAQVETDWDAALQTALARSVKSDSREETTKTLQWLVAQLHDGHGNVFDPQAFANVGFAPVLFAWIEEQLVVTASESPDFEPGDVVAQIDGSAAADILADNEELISGSPQWKRYRSTSNLSRAENGDTQELVVIRDGEELTATLTFKPESIPTMKKPETIELLVEGDSPEDCIYYVDLGRAKPDDVRPMIDKFAAARGIIFDLRGYPNGTQFLLQHMTDEHMQSQKWQVPRQIHPDRIDMQEIPTMSRWEMPAQQPRFKGKMIFLTNANAISYAESVMSIVANYKLGEIIGSPTAGANGNINPFELPGGYRVSWTGMRVMNHNDSPHHVHGVQPTIPLKPTIAAIREGRDEYIEKALELINDE